MKYKIINDFTVELPFTIKVRMCFLWLDLKTLYGDFQSWHRTLEDASLELKRFERYMNMKRSGQKVVERG